MNKESIIINNVILKENETKLIYQKKNLYMEYYLYKNSFYIHPIIFSFRKNRPYIPELWGALEEYKMWYGDGLITFEEHLKKDHRIKICDIKKNIKIDDFYMINNRFFIEYTDDKKYIAKIKLNLKDTSSVLSFIATIN